MGEEVAKNFKHAVNVSYGHKKSQGGIQIGQ